MTTSLGQRAQVRTGGLTVAARHARAFEPAGLGPLYPAFTSFLRRIANKRQSEILRQIARERQLWMAEAPIDSLAYQFTLSVLADSIAFGNYPVVVNGQCFLIPILEADGISQEQRRRLVQRLFRMARDRALADREQLRWLGVTLEALNATAYRVQDAIQTLGESPPTLRLLEAAHSNRTLDARALWRAVRTTWSMGIESSAPGREVAFLAVDERYPEVPLGILQFRNVVPEIVARDRWLGVTAAFDREGNPLGYMRYLVDQEAADRLAATRGVLAKLLAHINAEGLSQSPRSHDDPRQLAAFASTQRAQFNEARRQGGDGARAHLIMVKRAETAMDLIRGISSIDTALKDSAPLQSFSNNVELLRDLNAGLRKIWHYHMGFVALEMSVCGAAPPFGPLRVGKLMASIAASDEVLDRWGHDRPLGEIAAETYQAAVRDAVPNPGPIVIFTSGLYPGHSAQYNRLRIGNAAWRKIGETLGYGSFHVSLETSRLAAAFNAAVDGYRHVSRAFGEGASPRFRDVDRAISRLELPDLLHHEISRPLYALPVVSQPQACLLGWEDRKVSARVGHSSSELAAAWWKRWVAPNSARLVRDSAATADLRGELATILQSAVDGASGS